MNTYDYGKLDEEWGSLHSKELWQQRAELEREVHRRVLARTEKVTALEKELREAQAEKQKLLDDLQGVAHEWKELGEKNEALQERLGRVLEMNADLNKENSGLHEANERFACLNRDLQAENFELKRPWFQRVWFSLVDRIPFRIVWR